MDKKNFPSLDELLNKVRQSEPVMQEDEAMNWLNAQKELPLQKHRSKPFKTIIMTSIIFSLGITVLLWSPQVKVGNSQQSTDDSQQSMVNGHQTTVDGQQTTVNSYPSKVEVPSNNAYQLSTVDSGLLTQIDTPRIDTFRVIKIQNDIRIGEGTEPGKELEQEFVFDIQIESADQSPCRDEVNALVLEPEALKKLGIVSDQGTLLYQQDHTPKGQVKLVFQGMMLSNQSWAVSGLSHLTAPDILPLGISNCKGRFQFPTSDIPDSLTLLAALAIRVPVNEEGDYLLFWFPRNKEILAMLPEQERETSLHSDVLYHQKPWSSPVIRMPMMAKVELKKLLWEPEETTIELGERAKDLGIKVDETGVHFKRDLRKVDLSRNWHNVEIKSALLEKEQFEENRVKKIQPFYVSKDHFYQGLGQGEVTSMISGTYESFTFDKFRLVALKVSSPEGDYIFWYPYSPALKSLLTPEEQKSIEAKLSKIDPAVRFDPIRPKYDKWEELFVDETPVTESLNAVEPGRSVLNKLGVKINEQGEIEVDHLYANNTMMVFAFSKQNTRVEVITGAQEHDSLTRNNLLAVTGAIVSITDDLGMQPRMFNSEFKDYQMNELIPVLVRSGQTYTLNDKINQNWRPDIILWFKPTKEILSILESEGEGAIWGDVTSVEIPDTAQADCRYTELCRNKPGVFNSALLFPNPASSFANFSWVAAEASDYTIKLFALNGAEVKAFTNLIAQPGKNQYTLDLAGLPPGIYMMILSSDKGDELHERLVIRE